MVGASLPSESKCCISKQSVDPATLIKEVHEMFDQATLEGRLADDDDEGVNGGIR